MSRPAYRKKLVHQAVVTATLGLGSLGAHAVNLDQADIQSAQHEPLNATINVSNIDASKFNAAIADSNTYQQMGLSQDDHIQVTFTPTSESTGKLTLSSQKPISKPFTDVVLNLNNDGEQIIEPQTLLMPLPRHDGGSFNKSTPIVVSGMQAQNLPIVSDSAAIAGTPLQVQNSAPPPLFPEAVVETTKTTDALITHTDAIATAAPVFVPMSDIEAHDPAHSVVNTQPSQTEVQTATNTSLVAALMPENSNTQLEILTETITRRILPAGTEPTEEVVKTATPTTSDTVAGTNTTTEVPTPTEDNADAISTDNAAAVYVVQSGDNLWSIASEIAKVNNLTITDVMNALHHQNPDAFNKGKASQLKVNATLSLPNYDVIPSQKAISDAIAAKRSALSARKKGGNAGNLQAKGKRKSTSAKHAQNNLRASAVRSKTVAKPLPKAQLTLVTANQGGQATGASTQNSKGGVGNSDLVATLKSTRSQAAASATRLNSLNQSLSAATHKLQIQNQRLAELEARLKALKEK